MSSNTARNRPHNLFRPKCTPIPLGHSDGRKMTENVVYPRNVDYFLEIPDNDVRGEDETNQTGAEEAAGLESTPRGWSKHMFLSILSSSFSVASMHQFFFNRLVLDSQCSTNVTCIHSGSWLFYWSKPQSILFCRFSGWLPFIELNNHFVLDCLH